MKGEAENEGGWWWWWSVGGIEQWSSTSISFYFERAKSNPMTSCSGFAQSKRNQEEPRGTQRTEQAQSDSGREEAPQWEGTSTEAEPAGRPSHQ